MSPSNTITWTNESCGAVGTVGDFSTPGADCGDCCCVALSSPQPASMSAHASAMTTRLTGCNLKTPSVAISGLAGSFRLLPHQRGALAQVAAERDHRGPGHQQVVVGEACPGDRKPQLARGGKRQPSSTSAMLVASSARCRKPLP